jgi:tetratricopeptide (TPR) repeat protein
VSRLADRLARMDRAGARPREMGAILTLKPPAREARRRRLDRPLATLGLAVVAAAAVVAATVLAVRPHLGSPRLELPAAPGGPGGPRAVRPEPAPAPSPEARATALVGRARRAAARGDTTEAVARFREALALAPERAEAWNDLGVILTRRGEADRGIEALARAVALRPDDGDARRNLAVALDRRGRSAEAVPHYRAFVTLSPDSPERAEAMRRLTDLGEGTRKR